MTKASIPESEAALAVKAEMDQARAEFTKAQQVFQRKYSLLEKKYQAALDPIEMNLENALVQHLSIGSNEEGYKWLNELNWKGAWKDLYITANGSYFPETNQRVIMVGIPCKDELDEAKLHGTIAEIERIIDIIIPDALVDSKFKDNRFKGFRVLEVREASLSENNSYYLGRRDVDDWAIFGSRYQYGKTLNTEFEGTLEASLRYLSEHLHL